MMARGDRRAEHLAADSALADGRAPLLLPALARDLLAAEVEKLHAAGLLHGLEAEQLRRVIGAGEQ